MKSKNIDYWKIFYLFLIVLGVVAIVFFFCTLFSPEPSPITQISTTEFSIGGLNANGKYKSTSESIYTKNAFGCQGLDVEINFDSNVKYQIFFYDNDDNFLSATSMLSTSYSNAPKLAKTCRVVITPKSDKDIKFWEVNGYAKQLTIKVDTMQEFKFVDNLFEEDYLRSNQRFTNTLIETIEENGVGCSKVIDVSKYSKMYVFVPNVEVSKNVSIFFADNQNIVQSSKVCTIDNVDNTGNWVEFEFDVPVMIRKVGLVYTLGYEVLVYGI